MKLAPTIAGGLLGLAFVVFGSNFFLNFIPMPADTVRSLADDLTREGWRPCPDHLLEALLNGKTAAT